MKFVESMGFRVFSDSLDKIEIHNSKCKSIFTIAPNEYSLSRKDLVYEKALKKSDFLVLDGVFFGFASLLLNFQGIKANHGPFVFENLMNRINKEKGKIFFLGSSETVLTKIKNNAADKYPDIKIATLSPPFKKEFTDSENDSMVRKINEFAPDVVFVGMGAPKQEKWAIKNRDSLNAGIVATIGNVFDWFAGTQKSIPKICFKLGIGWLVRMFLRPEIIKRNVPNQIKFLLDVALIFFRIKKEPKTQISNS